LQAVCNGQWLWQVLYELSLRFAGRHISSVVAAAWLSRHNGDAGLDALGCQGNA
jgi:hypothetical protein